MPPVVIGLTLFAAALHATWNAFLRSGRDRLWTVTVMSFATTAAAIPAALLLPRPLPSCWLYIAISSSLQVGYSIFLAHAYRHGELGQVYPVIRGAVPLLVTLGGLLLAGQQLSPRTSLGIALICGGIGTLTVGRTRASTATIVLACVTALFVASYVTADGIGVRRAGNAQSYVAWVFLAHGILMPAAFLLVRQRLTLDLRPRETIKAVTSGLISLLSYGAFIAALSAGKIGPVSALRETSIVFSVLIGRIVLGEALTRRRIIACLVVATGAACVAYQA